MNHILDNFKTYYVGIGRVLRKIKGLKSQNDERYVVNIKSNPA